MPAITSTNVAQAIVKLVAADALPALVGNLVMGNLVNRNYEPVLAQAGDTVNVPIAPQLSANNIAEGQAVTYDMKPTRDDPTAVGTSQVADAVIAKLGG